MACVVSELSLPAAESDSLLSRTPYTAQRLEATKSFDRPKRPHKTRRFWIGTNVRSACKNLHARSGDALVQSARNFIGN